MNLYAWAARWNLPNEVVWDLMSEFGINPMQGPTTSDSTAKTEDGVNKRVRLSYAKAGGCLWRNNVGAMEDVNGRVIRFGLANESARMNKETKSSDLIGLMPILITPEMVGRVIGQFVARESKKPGWVYTGTERETAQWNYIKLVASMGGDAAFTCGD